MADHHTSPNFTPVETAHHLLPLSGFHALLWTGFAICIIALIGRIYIRLRCFKRLLIDDWMILFASVMLLCVAALTQTYLRDIYTMMSVTNGDLVPGPDFLLEAQRGIRGFGAAVICSYLGIWGIKLNFLLFFKRLGTQIFAYRIFWWIVLAVTIVCGAITIGITQFHCVFGTITEIMTICPQYPTLKQTNDLFMASCILDVLTDVLILCFPMVILWKVKIDLKKKIILSAIFSLVSFTIAVTIIRGSIFDDVYKKIDEHTKTEMNVTWIWLWFYVEFSVSFLIACLISFRALFVQRQEKNRVRSSPIGQNGHGIEVKSSTPKISGFMNRARRIHDTLLESFKESEVDSYEELPLPASGRFSVNFTTNFEAV